MIERLIEMSVSQSLTIFNITDIILILTCITNYIFEFKLSTSVSFILIHVEDSSSQNISVEFVSFENNYQNVPK